MVGIRKPKTALKFEKPAGWWGALWREALPAGNGLIGAAVYGNVEDETIMLSHGNLSWQGYIGVLPDVAERLKDVFGEHCYRFGGDEFVVITALSADQAAARIGEVDQAISRAAQDTALHLSAGICSVTEGSTPYEVLTHADKALYQAKKEGKACSTVY